jgi:hypothetical protein
MSVVKKYKSIVQTLLHDKYVLYFTVFVALGNLTLYGVMKEYTAILFFAVIGFLTSYFSKNMILILGAAICATFIVVALRIYSKVREGLETNIPKPKAKATAENTDEHMQSLTPDDVHHEDDDDDDKQPHDNYAENKIVNDLDDEPDHAHPQKKAPTGNKPKINYASTIESAYDNLDKLLSSDAIKNMSVDTQRLADKQQSLMTNIEKLEPMINMAKGMMDKFNVDGIAGKLVGMQKMLGKNMDKNDADTKGLDDVLAKGISKDDIKAMESMVGGVKKEGFFNRRR